MSLVAPWQQRYLFGLQATSISTAVDFTATSTLAEVTDAPLLKTTNHPFDLDAGIQFIDQRKAFGQSTRYKGAALTGEFQIGAQIPTFTFEMDATPNILKLLLWTLFQTGTSEGAAAPYVVTCTPYTSPSAEVWASIVDLLSTSTAGENQIVNGAICRSLTLSGNMTDQSVKVSAEMVGYDFTATHDASSDQVTDPNIAPLLFKNMTFELGGQGVNISSFSLTISNNAFSPVYHAANPVKHVLNDLTVEGEFSLPRDSGHSSQDDNQQVSDWIAGTDKIVTFYWGASPAASNGDVSLIFNGLLNAFPSRTADEEIGSTVSWMNVDDASNDISLTVADNIDRGIP